MKDWKTTESQFTKNPSPSILLWRIFFTTINRVKEQKWSPGVDPGFPVGGGANPPGGANIWFCQILQKTAWNWENFGRRGDTRRVHPP